MQVQTRQGPAYGVARLRLKVWTQTRNPTELLSWISPFIGTGNSGTGSTGLNVGGLFGRD